LAIISDETTDFSRIEQLTFVARFADSNLNIQERFLGFWATPDVKSETLFFLISKLKYNLTYKQPLVSANTLWREAL
jgi:hypothetical protein